MTSIFEKLSGLEIVNSKIIKQLQESINHKYPHYSSKQKAQMLAVKVYEIIEGSLPNYSMEAKKELRNYLIKEKLSKNSLTINFQDVVDSSINVVEVEQFQAKLPEWVQANTDIEIESVKQFLYTLKEIDRGAVKEVAVTSQLVISERQQRKMVTTESVISSTELIQNNSLPFNRKYIKVAIVAFFIMITIVLGMEKVYIETTESKELKVTENKIVTPLRPKNELPSHLQYKPVNEQSLQVWLNERNSRLAEEPYFSTIITVADQYNLHPFLLFAITGQEQGFVPRSNQNSEKIVNNPFNVFHSWEEYNTTILDSSEIAARTITNLSEERPEDANPFQWINRKYAEDPNWWKGVSSIFEKLEKEVQ